jgi:hypothetical protein
MDLLLAIVALAGWVSTAIALSVAVSLACQLHRAAMMESRLRRELWEAHVEQAWFLKAPRVWAVIKDWLHEEGSKN